MPQNLRLFLPILAFAFLAGCNGDLIIHEVVPKTIVLVDVTRHESFVAPRGCLTLGGFRIEKLGNDLGVADDIVRRIQTKLERDGYQVHVVPFSDTLDARRYPVGYMVTPEHPYETLWTPAFARWMGELDSMYHPGAVVFLTNYYKSLSGNQGPFYSGMGVTAQINCLDIPPTSGNVYANVGVDVFTFPEVTRKFFTYDARDACDVPLTDAVLDQIKAKTFGAQELAPFRGQLVHIGAVQVETELRHANVLRSPVDGCSD